MKVATISSAALTNATNHLRLVGDHDAAEALYALTDGHDALVIEGGEPLPRPIRISELGLAVERTKQLEKARRHLAEFEAVKPGNTAEVVFYAYPGPCRVFAFDTDDSLNSASERIDLMALVSEHLKKRVFLLEVELRELGVDPTADAA